MCAASQNPPARSVTARLRRHSKPGPCARQPDCPWEKNKSYRITVVVTDPWEDGHKFNEPDPEKAKGIETGPQGFGWSNMIWPMQLGVPLRRLLASNWFATIIRIGNTGFGETCLRYDRKEQPLWPTSIHHKLYGDVQGPKNRRSVRLRQRRRYRHPPVFRSFLCVEQQGKGRSDARACERPIARSTRSSGG